MVTTGSDDSAPLYRAIDWPTSCCPWCRYFAYVQVADEEQNLWRGIRGSWPTAQHSNFAMRKATEASQIYPVFRDLFKKEGAAAVA